MPYGLNFNRLIFTVFLAFVSLQDITPAQAESSHQTKDEFQLFEEEIKSASPSAKGPPKPKPADSAKSPEAAPPPPAAPETPEQKIERLKTEIRSHPKNAALIVDLAEILYQQGQYEKVSLLLWKHVETIGRRGLLLLANSHEKKKEPGEMLRALNILVGKDEKDFEAYTMMGKAYVQQRKSNDAMESFKKAIELNPKFEPAYDGLAAFYEKRDEPNLYELRILFQDMIKNIGNRPQYLRKLCEINTLDGTFEAAIRSCKEAIAKDSKTADPYVYLGLSYKALGEDKQYLSTLKKAAKNHPESELAQFHYGQALEDQKNYIDAMKVYKTGTEANKEAARSWLGLATTSFELRKFEIALLAYRNACKFDKKNAVAFRRATTILRNTRNAEWTGQFESASENCTFQ